MSLYFQFNIRETFFIHTSFVQIKILSMGSEVRLGKRQAQLRETSYLTAWNEEFIIWNRHLPFPNGLVKTPLGNHRLPSGKQETMELPAFTCCWRDCAFALTFSN